MYIQLLIIILGFFALKWFPQVGSEAYQAKQHKKYIIFMMVLLILQSGLRHVAVGADTYQYFINHYVEVERSSWSSLWQDCLVFYNERVGKDPGYHLFLKVIQIVLPTYQLYLLGLAAFVFYGLGRMLNSYTKSNYEVLLAMALYQCLYYAFFSITGLRQTMATGFLFLALPYVRERKPLKFAILVLLAATQHKSALLFCPFYFLPMFKHSRLMLKASFVTFIPMWIYGKVFAGYFLMGTTMEQYSAYLSGYDGAGAYGFAAYILLLGILLIINHKKIVLSERSPDMILNAVAIAIMLTPLTMIDPSNMRVVQYYSIYALIALPWAIKHMSFGKDVNSRYLLVTLLLTLYTMIRNTPYAFFWQEMALGSNY